MPEFRSNDAAIAVGSRHSSPNHSKLARILALQAGRARFLFRSVHERDALSHVEFRLLAFFDAVDAQKGRIGMLVSEPALEAEKNPFAVESR